MKSVLITGGAGFIGVNAARYFLKKGWSVVVLDDFSRKGTDINIKNLTHDHTKKVRVVRADVTKDTATLRRETARVDAVIHLAAQVAVTTSITDPVRDFEINALGTFNVLEAIRAAKKQPALIFASTNKVYGSLPHIPVKKDGDRYRFKNDAVERYGVSESEPLDFHSPYGCSKGAADQYVIDYSRIYGLKTVVFRQSCIYGEHQFGVEDQGWVAWFTIAVLKGRHITIYGDGRQVRDVLYVGDLIELYDRALSKIEKVSGNAYNIGGSPKNTISLRECLAHLESRLKTKIKISHADVRAGDQPIFVADTRKASKDLGWKPTTSFKTGFDRMYGWMIENKDAVLSL
jgi:CDP-paratose 2-epimerase